MARVLSVIALGLFVVILNVWLCDVDKVRSAALAEYETCVQSEYGTTSHAFESEHGYLPECNR